jgi:hypothetical protein
MKRILLSLLIPALAWGQSVTLDSEWDTVAEINTATTDQDFIVQDGTVDLTLLNFTDATTLTASTGAVTATQVLHIIAAEGAGTTDTIDSIAGGATGDILIVRPDSGDTITFADGTAGGDNLDFAGQDVVLDSVNERLVLEYNGTNWVIVAVSPNVLGVTYVETYEEKHAGSHTVSIDGDTGEGYGSVHYVTSTGTITLPAVVDGTSFTIITVGAIAVSVDVNASDLIMLDGTALDDGDKITNTSTSGDIAVLTYYDATGWYAATNGWTDGGP